MSSVIIRLATGQVFAVGVIAGLLIAIFLLIFFRYGGGDHR